MVMATMANPSSAMTIIENTKGTELRGFALRPDTRSGRWVCSTDDDDDVSCGGTPLMLGFSTAGGR